MAELLPLAGGDDLEGLLGEVDALAALADAARVGITVEALVRGQVPTGATGRTSTSSVVEWLREHAPSTRQGAAGAIAKVAVLAAGGDRSGSLAPDAPLVDRVGAEGLVTAAVLAGEVSSSIGLAALSEVERLRPRLVPAAVPSVASALLELGSQWGAGVLRRLRPRLLAEHGRPGELDEVHERLRGAARLSAPFVRSADLTEYQLWTTPEQATVLEAAIGPLSAPYPNEATGERDLRPAGQRRVEALAEVCRRSSALDAEDGGRDGAAAAAAAVHVTIALSDLRAGTGGAEVLGSTASGTILSAGALRRISCDAELIPHVLGTASEELDLGRVARLFTRAQRRSLRRRDRGCTYPGCTAPSGWTRAHHVLHWCDHGRTDPSNAASLCERHHDTVHRRRLWADVRSRPDPDGRFVVWDLHDGSYDRHLETMDLRRSAPGPPGPSRPHLAKGA